MNCEDVRSLLADAVGHELNEPDGRALELHAARCAACRDRLAELRGMAMALRALAPADSDVAAQAASIVLSRPSRPAVPTGSSLLRYAAVMFLAFGAGYFVRGVATDSQSARPAPIAEAQPARPSSSLETYIARNYPRVASEHPDTSQLGLSLLSIARR